MSAGARYAGLFSAMLASVGILFCTIFREWKRNSRESSQANLQQIYSCEGLWVRCTSPLAGQFQCDQYDVSLIGVPAQLQAMRAMMILATLLITIALVTSIVALPCTAALSEKQKVHSSRAAGGMAFVAGGLCLAAVSWYATEVIYEFFAFETQNSSFKYEFGAALYIGWVSGGFALISGILLACCTCGDIEDVDDYPYTYKPSKPAPSRNATEYV